MSDANHPAVVALRRIFDATRAQGGTFVMQHENEHIDFLRNNHLVEMGQAGPNGVPVRATAKAESALAQYSTVAQPVAAQPAPQAQHAGIQPQAQHVGGFAIEDGVAMPTRRAGFVRTSTRQDLPFDRMQVGQSVFIRAGGDNGDDPVKTYSGDVSTKNKKAWPVRFSLVKAEGGARLFRAPDGVGPKPVPKPRAPKTAGATASPAAGAPVAPQGWGAPAQPAPVPDFGGSFAPPAEEGGPFTGFDASQSGWNA